jgi:hypothetical protein
VKSKSLFAFSPGSFEDRQRGEDEDDEEEERIITGAAPMA